MKRQLTSILLFSALLVGGASTFVSCTDNESDSAYDTSVSQIAKLTELNKWLGELKETNPDLKSAIDARIQANMDVIKDGVFADKERIEAAIQGSEAYKNLKGQVDGVDARVSALERLRLTDSIAAKKITDALDYQISTKILRKVLSSDDSEAFLELLDATKDYPETQRLITKRLKDLR